jgi:hypothetical protein
MMTEKAELLAKASKPAEEALRLHAYYKGKMQTLPKCAIRKSGGFFGVVHTRRGGSLQGDPGRS